MESGKKYLPSWLTPETLPAAVDAVAQRVFGALENEYGVEFVPVQNKNSVDFEFQEDTIISEDIIGYIIEEYTKPGTKIAFDKDKQILTVRPTLN